MANFKFLKKPEFWVTTLIAILLTFAGGFLTGKSYIYYFGSNTDIKNNQNCAINSNSPNSIATQNQMGNNVIVTPKKPDRHLNDNMKSQLNAVIINSNVTQADITYEPGDEEANNFAIETANYLKSKLIKVNGPSQGIMMTNFNVSSPQSMFVDRGVLKIMIWRNS